MINPNTFYENNAYKLQDELSNIEREIINDFDIKSPSTNFNERVELLHTYVKEKMLDSKPRYNQIPTLLNLNYLANQNLKLGYEQNWRRNFEQLFPPLSEFGEAQNNISNLEELISKDGYEAFFKLDIIAFTLFKLRKITAIDKNSWLKLKLKKNHTEDTHQSSLRHFQATYLYNCKNEKFLFPSEFNLKLQNNTYLVF